MKKISILFLAFFSLLFVSMHAAPSVFAEGQVQHNFNLNVVTGAGSQNRHKETLSMNFGQELSVDISGLKDGKAFAFYIYNGQMETDEEALFMISGSTNLSVVLKDNASDVVAAFVDTNGELIDVKYSEVAFTPSTGDLSSPSKPGYEFDGYDVSQISEDTVFVAKYSRTNQEAINVTITDGTKDLEVVQYNDVVTLTPNAGNFSYWADEDGQVVSKNANYAFSALQDVTLNAVFDAPSNTDPVVYLSNVTGISPDTQSFLGHIEGDFVEYGVLASMNEEVLTLDSEDVEVIPSQGLVPLTNEFLRSIPSSLGYKTFRAYAKLASGDVYYSDNNHFLYEDELSQEYNEDFSSLGNNNSYSNREIDGNSIIWNATDAREDQSLNGKAITIRSGILSTTFPSGLSNLMFNYKKSFSDNDGAFSIYINNIKIGDTIYLTNGQGITQFNLTNLNYTGPVDLEIHIENRVTIDDITWTDLTLTNIETKLYNIKFIEDENNSIDVALEVHKKLTELIDPIKEGYTFLGWFDEEENLFDFDTPITRHMTLTAEFEINEYTLTFDTDGGSLVDPITQDFESAVIAPSNPTKEGYSFAGWNPALPTSMPSSDETYTALWTINNYDITFDVDGGDAIAPLSVEYASLLDLPTPTKTDFFFGGWYSDEELLVPFEDSIMPASNLTLYAKWTTEVQEVTVSFESNEGSSVSNQVVNLGSTITEPADPTKTGYDFDGWFVDQEFSAAWNFEATVTNDMTLYAKWSIKVYQITFDGNNGLPETQSLDVNHGESLGDTPNEPTRSGYEFVGWFDTDADSGGSEWNPLTEYTANKTYFARWEESIIYPVNASITNVGPTITTAIPSGDITNNLFIENPNENSLTVTYVQGTGNNSIFNNSADEIRLYVNGEIKIEVDGALITGVSFTTSRNNGVIINSGGTITNSTVNQTFEGVEILSIKANGAQVRMGTITITYLPQ